MSIRNSVTSSFTYIISILLITSTLQACSSTQEKVAKTLNTQQNTAEASDYIFDSGRLTRINKRMQNYIDSGKLVGISTLVAHQGEIVQFATQGQQDREAGIPLSKETIFRIYSMTKPVTAVAALTLWERGLFHMHDPISMYLPELKDLEVYVSGEGENVQTKLQVKPIRIIDLFTHTAGFSYGFTQSPVDKLYQVTFSENKVRNSAEFLALLASLPLHHEPGTAWHYGMNTDVLGILVERLSGMKLGDYMQKHIFAPLQMQDTGFFVPPAKLGRLKQIYTANSEGQTVVRPPSVLGDFKSDPDIHNGGGGLVSTINDYFRFAQMLLNDGVLDGQRVLGSKTVEYMRTNHLSPELLPYANYAEGEGYGLAVSVTVDTEQLGFLGAEGNFGWGGMASTYVRIDPKHKIILLSMAQFVPIGYHRYQDDFRNIVYQALIKN